MDAIKQKFIHRPLLKWKCPPKIALSSDWHIAAGEESEEVKTQKHREKRVPEAVYPRRSHIPPSPSPPFDAQEGYIDESVIPLVPITPIEDQPAEENDSSSPGGLNVLLPSTSAVSQNDAFSHPEPSTVCKPALDAGSSAPADVALAAATVASALMKSKESGSSIDTNLLVQILSDPIAVQKLISEVGASSSRKNEPVSETKISKTNMPLASSKPGKLKDVCNELGALKESVDKSGPKLYTAVADKENTSLSSSDQVKWELGAFDKRVVHVPGAKSVSPQLTFVSQPDVGGHKSMRFPTTPIVGPLTLLPNSKPDLDEFKWTNCGELTKTDAQSIRGPLVSLPNSNIDLDEFKWMNNGYGVSTKIDVEPNPRSNLFAPEVTAVKPNENLAFPTNMNVYSLPNQRQAHSLLKAVLSDAVRPTDSRLMSMPSDASRVNLYPSSNQVQTGLQIMEPFPNKVRSGFETNTPLPNHLELGSQIMGHTHNVPSPFLNKAGLETNAPLPNQLELGSQIMRHKHNASTPFLLPNASPRSHGNNYLKSLVKQHGKIQEAQDYSLSIPQQDPKLAPPYSNPIAHATKIQRPCFFFNRPEGCRHGYTCPYLHDQPQNLQLGSVMGAHSSKRMKMNREIPR